MVDFELKKLLLQNGKIEGHTTYLIPTPSLSLNIINQFSQEDYGQIFSRKSRAYIRQINHKPWNIFFELFSKSSKENFGFLWVIINDDIRLDVSLHGGSWKKSLGMGLLYVDAWNVLLKELQYYNIVIHTSCKLSNKKAIRFIESGNFTISKKDNNYIFFRLEK